jgi:glycosyltransferase involved in cell wall biosynthesis
VLQKAIEGLPDVVKNSLSVQFIGKLDQDSSKNIKTWAKTVGTKIYLHGELSSEKLAKIYAASMVNVLPSLNINDEFEGYGIVHSEAIACGTITIGSLDTGNEDAVANGNGYLLKQSDHKSLQDLIFHIFNKKSKIKPVGKPPHQWKQIVKMVCSEMAQY